MKDFILREARAVFVWSLVACTLRLFLSLLDELSSLRTDLISSSAVLGEPHRQQFCFAPSLHGQCWKSGAIIREFLLLLSVLAGVIIRMLPAAKTSVGFSFASTWVLYPICDR
jgi:hypothetical protein